MSINSMFRWYQQAAICYAYLSDVDSQLFCDEHGDESEAMSYCRWFTRGWTLQELIAPRKVEFYDKNWVRFGTKQYMKDLISRITGIDGSVLVDSKILTTIPVAQRMSWAAKREASVTEDKAYCLLGIFDVSMPMVYGEGLTKAFLRLQRELFAQSHDLSIFLWDIHGLVDPPPYLPMFAPSPELFAGCSVSKDGDSGLGSQYLAGAASIHSDPSIITLPHATVAPCITESGQNVYVLRPPYMWSPETNNPMWPLRIILEKVGPGLFVRSAAKWVAREEGFSYTRITCTWAAQILVSPQQSIFRELDRSYEGSFFIECPGGLGILNASPAEAWCSANNCFLTHSFGNFFSGNLELVVPGDNSFGHWEETRFKLSLSLSKERAVSGAWAVSPSFSIPPSGIPSRVEWYKMDTDPRLDTTTLKGTISDRNIVSNLHITATCERREWCGFQVFWVSLECGTSTPRRAPRT